MDADRLDLAPYVAHAVAMQDGAGRWLDRAEDLPLAAEDVRHPALLMGRAEFYPHALKALEVLRSGDAPLIGAMLRAADGRLYRLIERGDANIAAVYAHVDGRTRDDDVQMINLLLIAWADLALIRPEDKYGDLTAQLAEYVNTFRAAKTGGAVPDMPAAEIRRQFGVTSIDGYTAFWDACPDEMDEALLRVQRLFDGGGMSIDDYCHGVRLDAADFRRAAGLDEGQAWHVLLHILLHKAAVRDRDYLVRREGSARTAEAVAAKEQARREAAELAGENAALAAKLAALTAARDALQSRLQKAEAEADALRADAAETAALRSALWDAQRDAGDVAPARTAERAMPDGVICVGGHSNWAALMRRELPTVTFIPSDVSFTDAQIRGASEVWFNLSHLGHPTYYRAIGLARQAGVPVRYLGSLSVPESVRKMLAQD